MSTRTDSNVEGWTESRLRGFIIGALRQGFRRYPNKYRVLKNACVGVKTNKASGRKAAHYRCAKCKAVKPRKEVQVDHIEPVVAATGFVDWNTYISRMYCSESNLQVLCKKCHKTKSLKERLK